MKKILFAFALSVVALTAGAQTLQQTPKGLQYQILSHGNGPKLQMDSIITLQMIQKTEKDSVLFSTYKAGAPMQIKMVPSQSGADPMDVFPFLSVKDSVLIKVPSDSVFKDHEDKRPPFLPAKSNIVFVVKVVKMQTMDQAIAERNAQVNKMQQDEVTAMNNFIVANKLDLKTTPSGLKYAITSVPEKGTHRKPLPGDTLLVNYVGRTLDGKVFDTSVKAIADEAKLERPANYPYQPIPVVIGMGNVIPGWDEGLLLMPEGSAAKFVIPSKLGYGPQGAGPNIPPFATLVFDVNLVKILPIKHAAAAPATTAKKSTSKKTTTKAVAKKAPAKKSH